MSLAVLQLADAGDRFAALVWVVIALGPALLKILKKVASAVSPGGEGQALDRPTRAPHGRPEASPPDLSDGAERWRRLLAGEEEPAPAAAPVPTPPAREPSARTVERAPEAVLGRGPRPRRPVVRTPDEELVEPSADSAYAVATDAYEIEGQEPSRESAAAARDGGEPSTGHAGARVAARVPAPLGFDRRSLRAGILWSELLAPPLALRGSEVPGGPAGPGGEAHL